jgi:hypothetical protein
MWVVLFYLLYSTLHDTYAPKYVNNWKQMLIFVPIFKLIGIYLLSLRQRKWPNFEPVDRNLFFSTMFYCISSLMTYFTFHFYEISAFDYSIMTKPKIFWCILFVNPSPLRLFISMFTFVGIFNDNYSMVKIILTLKCIFSAIGSVFSAKYVLFGEEADFQKLLNRTYTFTIVSTVWSFTTFVLSDIMHISDKKFHFTFDVSFIFCIFGAINSLLIAFILSKNGPVIRESLNSLKDIIFMLTARKYPLSLLFINMLSAYFLLNVNANEQIETIEHKTVTKHRSDDNAINVEEQIEETL